MFFSGMLFDKERKLEDLSLRELEEKVFEITKKQNSISHYGLSEELAKAVHMELQAKKKELLKIMHKKVDEL